jgi:hypothetical protein
MTVRALGVYARFSTAIVMGLGVTASACSGDDGTGPAGGTGGGS